MSNHTGIYPRLAVEATGTSIVSHAGAALLLRTADKIGLTSSLSAALTPWRKPIAVHDPGKTGWCHSVVATALVNRSGARV